jgi:hypothetical protein
VKRTRMVYSPKYLEGEFSEVRSRLAKGFEKRFEKDARPLKIHREFIAWNYSA